MNADTVRRLLSRLRHTPAAIAVLLPVLAAAGIAVAVLGPGQSSRAGVASTAGPSSTPPPKLPSGPAYPSPVPPPPAADPQPPVPGTPVTLVTLRMFDTTTGWAVDQYQRVLRTTDGGRSWRDVGPGPEESGVQPAVAFIGPARAWVQVATTGGARAFVTDDGGAAWTPVKPFYPSGCCRTATSFVDTMHGWAAELGAPASQDTFQGVVIGATSDGGRTWRQLVDSGDAFATPAPGAPPGSCGKSGISFVDTRTGWLTGGCAGGITFEVTHDGGHTWTRQALPSPSGGEVGRAACEAGPCALSAPRFTSPGDGTMTLFWYDMQGSRSTLYVTRDGGRSWAIDPTPTRSVSGVFFTDAAHGWLAGGVDAASGPICVWSTPDGGRSWSCAYKSRQSDALDFVDVLHGWAILTPWTAMDGEVTLMSTANGGRDWTAVHPLYAG